MNETEAIYCANKFIGYLCQAFVAEKLNITIDELKRKMTPYLKNFIKNVNEMCSSSLFFVGSFVCFKFGLISKLCFFQLTNEYNDPRQKFKYLEKLFKKSMKEAEEIGDGI